MKGIFIAFEGIDGTGKSTITNLIYDFLKEKYDVIKTREPGGTPISEKIRNIILNVDNKNMTARTEALLYAASRAQHVEEKIIPALEEGKIVLCERFLLSSLAYQGYARNLGEENIYNLNMFAINGLSPDITFLFDSKEKNVVNRKRNLDADRLENENDEFYLKVKNAYKELGEKYNCVLIDTTKSIEEVYNQCIDILNEKLKGLINR